MEKLSFNYVKSSVVQWLNLIEKSLKKADISVEIKKNTYDCLNVDFDFGECLAELLVEKSNFVPYKYISFEAAAIINGSPNLFYSWYDEENISIEKIIKGLNESLETISCENKKLQLENKNNSF